MSMLALLAHLARTHFAGKNASQTCKDMDFLAMNQSINNQHCSQQILLCVYWPSNLDVCTQGSVRLRL